MDEKGVPLAIGDMKKFFADGKEITLEVPAGILSVASSLAHYEAEHQTKTIRGVLLPNSAFHLKDERHQYAHYSLLPSPG
jgi:hypothetical protein